MLGRARPELRTDIRSFAYKGYVILFRYTENTLEVVSLTSLRAIAISNRCKYRYGC